MRKSRLLPFALATLGTAALTAVPGSGDAAAVTMFKEARRPFLYDITMFTTSMSLPVIDRLVTVRMSDKHLEERLDRSAADETIEPLSLILSDDPGQIRSVAGRLAAPDRQEELTAWLTAQVKQAKPVKKEEPGRTVEISRDAFGMFDREAFVNTYAKTHHDLTLKTAELRTNGTLRRELMRQVGPFLGKADRRRLLKQIRSGEDVSISQALLPEFARRMVGKYIIYRGPNCFHAALAFQSPQYTSSSLINVKTETGYHRAMINYDELWRVMNHNFYEIDPDKVPLKFGDLLAFFDVPEAAESDDSIPVDYKWIRHAATYLFGGYTFSKGSKSPNTPYTVRTLAEEWHTWRRYTKNLGIKVFRRSEKVASARPPRDLNDWIY